MIALAVLPGFLITVLIICIVPGPDMALIIATSLSSGVRAGIAVAVGMAAGMGLWTAGTAFGVGALIRHEPALFTAVRIGGAAYLLWLGTRSIHNWHVVRDIETGTATSGTSGLTRGMISNLANPKIVVFFAAFLPQFVDPRRPSAATQLIVLGVVFLAVGLVIDCCVAAAAGRLHSTFRTGGRITRLLDLVAGITYCVLAVALAVEVVA